MDCSPPGSSVHGILQARKLEWVVISFSGDLPNPEIEPGSPALLADSLLAELPGKPYKQNASCEMLDWMNHKLESSLQGEISTVSDMQMISL